MKVDYSKSLIYKICCKDPGVKEIYIGSTTSLKHRRHSHKTICNNENSRGYNFPVYQFIRQTGNWNNWSMILLEKYPCKDKLELEKRERYWIETLKSSLNKRVPGRSPKEYREQNREKEREQNKNYRIENRDKIKEQRKNYYLDNKELIKERNKAYREQNREKEKERTKEWREQNKEKERERKGQKITCDCGATLTRGCLSRHSKTKKHQSYEQIRNFIYC